MALGDAVGLVLHSALLVPYHSWRISHAKHHRSTNDMDNDEVFVPYTLSEYAGATPNAADDMVGPLSVVYRVVQVFKFWVFGWPAYLTSHVTGKDYGSRTNHFEPTSPLFSAKEFGAIVLSDVALAAVLAGLYYGGSTMGWLWLVRAYVIPYLLSNMWLVTYTDLQHTDVRLPHYRGEDWSWIKGALCTLDRDYGIYNVIHHHIGDTHVAHHLVSGMPHYNAQKATERIRPLLGKYYLLDDKTAGVTGVLEALWETVTNCRFVADEGGTLWWRRSVHE